MCVCVCVCVCVCFGVGVGVLVLVCVIKRNGLSHNFTCFLQEVVRFIKIHTGRDSKAKTEYHYTCVYIHRENEGCRSEEHKSATADFLCTR